MDKHFAIGLGGILVAAAVFTGALVSFRAQVEEPQVEPPYVVHVPTPEPCETSALAVQLADIQRQFDATNRRLEDAIAELDRPITHRMWAEQYESKRMEIGK